jgi:outer membrane protein TolC
MNIESHFEYPFTTPSRISPLAGARGASGCGEGWITRRRSFRLAAILLGCCALARMAHGVEKPGVAKRAKERYDLITLEQAYDRTLATDQTIRIAYYEVRKAKLLPWSALTRMGLQVNANSNYLRSQEFERIPTAGADSLSCIRAGSGTAGISVQQPLIDFTVFPAYRLGRLTAAAARLEHQYTVRETLFGVATAYYQVLKDGSLVNVNRESLRLASEQLSLAEKRANVGEVTRVDVLRAEVTVETARRTVVESENALEGDRNTLRDILNFAPDAPLRVVEPPDYPTTLPPFEGLLSRAYAHREDYRIKIIAIDQDTERRNSVIAEYGPRLVAEWDGSLNHTSGTAPLSDNYWQATVSVQVPILNGGQREIDLRTANEQIEETKLDRERTAKTVESDVKTAWLAVRTAEQILKALHAQVVAAEQAYHDSEIQYRAGTATSTDLLAALNDLNTARIDLTTETYDYQVALRNLEEVAGVFQEPRVQKVKVR